MITNCKVKFLDESKNKNSIFFSVDNIKFQINSKKIILCAGAIESCLLIINSVKEKKNLKS